jgi:hypothetical protein
MGTQGPGSELPQYEQAKLCPRCKLPGEVVNKMPAPNKRPGTQVHVVTCRTSGCRWENTDWIIQVNADGSVPPPQNHRPGTGVFSGLRPTSDEESRILSSLQKQVAQETKPGGGEVRNPHSSRG